MLKRLIIAAVTALLLGIAAFLLFQPPNPGRTDRAAAKRIRLLCGTRTDCQVHLRDIVSGNWDEFYESTPGTAPAKLKDTLETSNVPASNPQRTLVFMKNGVATRIEHMDDETGQPLAGEVEFEPQANGPHPGWVKYVPDSLLHVTFCKTKFGGSFFAHNETYFLLTPVPLPPGFTLRCQQPRR